jgi:hypothetical protein
MGEDRDTRVETLQPGDKFRWGGQWYTLRRRTQSHPEFLYLETTERAGNGYKTFHVHIGWFVAAECVVRS